MLMMAGACLDCGALMVEPDGRRCPSCERTHNQARAARKPHHYGPGTRLAMRKVVDRAKSDPSVRCWLCGSRELPSCFNDARWTADHATPGDAKSELHPAHAGCNYSRGDKTLWEFRAMLAERLG